jgi:uncharacterized MAPEG superfamily protein
MTPIDALAAFAIITLVIIGTEIFYTYATQGFGYGFSSNCSTPELSPFGQRLKRTLQNHIESAAYVVPVLAGAAFLGMEGGGVALAALLIIVGRALFTLLYLSGIAFIRVPAFGLATVSSLYLAVLVLMNMPG